MTPELAIIGGGHPTGTRALARERVRQTGAPGGDRPDGRHGPVGMTSMEER